MRHKNYYEQFIRIQIYISILLFRDPPLPMEENR